jgi:ATPase subunit of ABC transporter with duplicated ATPase domains
LHQVTCQFATGETLFGPLNFSLENSLCGLVGRNGVGKTRLLRLLAGIDTPSGGHIERPVSLACVAQQHAITPQTTLAGLLGYGPTLRPCSASGAVRLWLTMSIASMAAGISRIA